MRNIFTKPFYIALIAMLCTWNLNAQELHNITLIKNPPQGGVLIGGGSLPYGSSETVMAIHQANWSFFNWTEDGTEVSTDAFYTFTVERDRNLVANFVPTAGVITLLTHPVAGGIAYGSGVYEYGTVITITAIPQPYFEFLYWTNEDGELFSVNAICCFTVIKDHTLIAHFGITASFDITVSANPVEGGTVSGAGSYPFGTTVTVTAEPHPDFLFLNWTENGNMVSTDPHFAFSVYGPRNLVANFVPATCEITLSKNIEGAGALHGAGIYNYGQMAIVYADNYLPEYMFAHWTEDGNIVSYGPVISAFQVTQSRHLVAHFKPAVYEIPVYANPYEGGAVEGGGIHGYGVVVTIAATANEGYQFLNWTKFVLGNGAVVSTDPHYTFEVTGDVLGNCAFVAYFTKEEKDALSIEPIDAGAMKIYPNPVNSDMTVVLNNSVLRIVEMELYDLTGRKVYQQTVNQSRGTLQMNDLAQGTYLLKVYLDQGDVVVQKVVKN